MSIPIFISVYDRPNHFLKCINSLKGNVGASQAILFISSDGPKCEQSEQRVNEVRKIISSVHGFRKIIVHAPKENTNGIIAHDVLTEIKKNYGACIATEDDNVFGKHALKYYNDALRYFWNDPKVHFVCGYTLPGLKFDVQRHLQVRSFTAWGIGLWHHKDITQFPDHKAIAQKILTDWDAYQRVNCTFPNIPSMLLPMADGRIRANDIVRSAQLVDCDATSIFPSKSVVENIGSDGSGRHKVKRIKYNRRLPSDEKVIFYTENLAHDSHIFEDHFFKYFGGSCRRLVNVFLFKYINRCKGVYKYYDRFLVRVLGKICSVKVVVLFIAELLAVSFNFVS